MATGSRDNIIKLISIPEYQVVHTYSEHSNIVWSVQFHPIHDNILISASNDKTIRIWDNDKKAQFKVIEDHTDWVYCAQFDKDGKSFYSCSRDETLKKFSFDVKKFVEGKLIQKANQE